MINILLKEIDQDKLTFERLEKIIFNLLQNIFQQMMVIILEQIDNYLMAGRDRKRYILKEKNPRTIETLFGEVRFKRRYYYDSCKKDWIHLLDEKLGLDFRDRTSPGLCELAGVWSVKGNSYREARDRVKDVFGVQAISHETARQVTIKTAEQAEAEEQQMQNEEGKREVEALFIEADGFNTYIQGRKKGRRALRETKMIVIHEGWELRQGKGDRADYRLKNPTYMTAAESREEFWEQVRGKIAGIYKDIDSIPVIINGDNAPWIEKGTEAFRNGYYQYDRFHISRELTKALRGEKENLRAAHKALKEDNISRLLIIAAEALTSAKGKDERDKLNQLRETLIENYENIRDYRERLKEEGKFEVKPEWRSMGSAESNVDKFKNRAAKRGRAWSEKGLESINICLSKLYEGTLPEYISRANEEMEQELMDNLKAGSGWMAKRIKNNAPKIQRGSFPAARCGTKGFARVFQELLKPEFLT